MALSPEAFLLRAQLAPAVADDGELGPDLERASRACQRIHRGVRDRLGEVEDREVVEGRQLDRARLVVDPRGVDVDPGGGDQRRIRRRRHVERERERGWRLADVLRVDAVGRGQDRRRGHQRAGAEGTAVGEHQAADRREHAGSGQLAVDDRPGAGGGGGRIGARGGAGEERERGGEARRSHPPSGCTARTSAIDRDPGASASTGVAPAYSSAATRLAVDVSAQHLGP